MRVFGLGVAALAIGLGLYWVMSGESNEGLAPVAVQPVEPPAAEPNEPAVSTPGPAPFVPSQETLPGTKWQRDAFAIEFREGGALFIGGRARAKWRIVDNQVELYDDDTGETHSLDIVGNRLEWRGQALGRVD